MSLLTNNSALSALQSLRQTSADLQTTQNRISSGLRVANASDNAAYFAISTTLKSDNGALGSVKDALGIGSSTIDVATSALSATTDVLNQIKQKLVAAQEPGIDRSKVQTEITQLTKQLKSIADSASFSGQNFLSVDTTAGNSQTVNVVGSFSRDTTGAVSVGKIAIDTASTKLYDVAGENTTYLTAAGTAAATAAASEKAYQVALAAAQASGVAADYATAATAKTTAATDAAALKTATTSQGIFDRTRIAASASSATGYTGTVLSGGIDKLDISTLTESDADKQKLTDYGKIIDAVLTDVTTAQSNLGSAKTRISLQQSFVANLSDALTRGVGTLVDADLNQESTRLQALQVQQQLGVQSLSIANQQNQQILKLFG